LFVFNEKEQMLRCAQHGHMPFVRSLLDWRKFRNKAVILLKVKDWTWRIQNPKILGLVQTAGPKRFRTAQHQREEPRLGTQDRDSK
jgi:hypothetical protein